MREDFDDTQFITFDILNFSFDIINEIRERFSHMGFRVLNGDEIRKVKKEYFKEYLCDFF